jgi:hypothetical protein
MASYELVSLRVWQLVDFVDQKQLWRALTMADKEDVTFYPTYGYRQDDNWAIPMRVWVHEQRRSIEDGIGRITNIVAKGLGVHGPFELDNFRSRTQDFVADSESREMVTFSFDQDSDAQQYSVEESDGTYPKTDWNGLVAGMIKVPVGKAKALLQRQGSQDGWLTYRATSEHHSGVGRVRLLEATGLSVISDIDDTVKITEIPAGAPTVIKNTFFHEFKAAPHMAKMYQNWTDASFHYVSGGPWQLYRPLSAFLFSESSGFPEGTFHMKNVTKNLLSANTWEDLKELVTNENLTFDLKVSYISEIMLRFPNRRFILVGDSGEKDPEVYREIKRRFSDQVSEIWIRDVINDGVHNKNRLDGMRIIEASTIA